MLRAACGYGTQHNEHAVDVKSEGDGAKYLNLWHYIYIYIYRERERERCKEYWGHEELNI